MGNGQFIVHMLIYSGVAWILVEGGGGRRTLADLEMD